MAFGLGSLISGGVNLIGSALGFSGASQSASASKYAADQSLQAQRETNQANREIAQQNNEFNKQMLEAQQKYNLEQWQRETEYDSAENQVKRLKAAGLNPYLMMYSNGSAGSAASGMSINPPTADQSGRQMPVDFSGYQQYAQSLAAAGQVRAQSLRQLGDAITQGMSVDTQIAQQRAQTAKTAAETNTINIENQYRRQMLRATLNKMLNESNLSKSQKKLLESQWMLNEQSFDFNESTWNDRMNEIRSRNELSAATKLSVEIDRQIKSKQLKWIDPQARMQLSVSLAQMAQAYSSAGLSEAMAKKAIADTIKTQRETVSEKQAMKLAEYAVETARKGSMYSDSWQYMQDHLGTESNPFKLGEAAKYSFGIFNPLSGLKFK